MIATVLVEPKVVLFITELECVAAHHFRVSHRGVFRLVDERIKLRPAHIGEGGRAVDPGDIQDRRDLAGRARRVINNQRIESPLGCVHAWVRSRSVSRNAVAVKLGHSKSNMGIED